MAIDPSVLRDPNVNLQDLKLDVSTKRQLAVAWLTVEAGLCKRHFGYFSKYALHHVYDQPFHKSWFDLWDGNDSCTLIGPRGFRKSTMLTEDYVTWRLCREHNLSTMVISETETQAEDFVKLIKTQFEMNEELRLIFGNLVSQQLWQSGQFSIKRSTTRREPSCKAVGVAGAVVGKHYDIIILDDSVSEGNSRTAHLRQKFMSWYYKEVYPAMNLPGGEIKKVGTKYHPKDMYWWWISNEDKESFVVTPCWNFDEKTGRKESIWPALQSTEQLIRKKSIMPPLAWDSQFEGKCDAVEGGICGNEAIKWYRETPPGLVFYNGNDFAVSMEDDACEFSTCTVGVDKWNNVFVDASMHGKFSIGQQLDIIQQHCGKPWNVGWCGVETNGFQLIMPQLFPLFEVSVPIKKITHQLSKEDRFAQLRPLTQQGKLYFKDNPGNKALVEQMVSWYPGSEEADRVDALYNAIFVAFGDAEIGTFEELAVGNEDVRKGNVNTDYAKAILGGPIVTVLEEEDSVVTAAEVQLYNDRRRAEYRSFARMR